MIFRTSQFGQGPRSRWLYTARTRLVIILAGLSGGILPLNAVGQSPNESQQAGQKGKTAEESQEVRLTDDAIKRYGVATAAVKREELTPTFTAPARIAFNVEAVAHVGAVVRGRAVELKVRRGDYVKQGDELVVIESPELGEAQSDLLQKRTTAEIARPAADLARDAFERAKRLFDESQGIALTEVQKRQSDYQAATGGLKAADAAVLAAENRLHLLGMGNDALATLVKSGEINPRYTIKAPLSGQVTQREVTLGELVSPDKEALLVIANTDTLWALADVPEALLGQVKVGSRARVTVAAAGVKPIAGIVSFIDPALDPNTRTARVRIEIKGQDTGTIRPGMFAQAELTAAPDDGKRETALVVPDEAVQTVDGESAVFVPVPGEANTFAKRRVVLGAAVGGMLPVQSGLKEGELIVIAGSFPMKAELGKGASEEH